MSHEHATFSGIAILNLSRVVIPKCCFTPRKIYVTNCDEDERDFCLNAVKRQLTKTPNRDIFARNRDFLRSLGVTLSNVSTNMFGFWYPDTPVEYTTKYYHNKHTLGMLVSVCDGSVCDRSALAGISRSQHV